VIEYFLYCTQQIVFCYSMCECNIVLFFLVFIIIIVMIIIIIIIIIIMWHRTET
jgi:hypothetical protein